MITLEALQQETLKYSIGNDSRETLRVNWAGLLDAEEIALSSWSVDDARLTIHAASYNTDSSSVTVSGQIGKYRLTNKIISSDDDVRERHIDLYVVDSFYD